MSTAKISAGIEPVWAVIERSQRQDFTSGCWLVPQPAHAALSGDIAAQLDAEAFPRLTPDVVRAIALHDAGWSLDDAAIIQQSRALGIKAKPYSFVAAIPSETVAAWTGSVAIAGKGSPLGGFLVSRHFTAIGQLYRAQVEAGTAQVLDAFLQQEQLRQQKLRRQLAQSDSTLDRLLAALQFCDLLSLYISCGAESDVEFPGSIAGKPIQLRRENGDVRLHPSPFPEAQSFSISALRHPALHKLQGERESSATFTTVCRG